MNVWLIAGAVLVCGLIPCGVVCLRGATMERLVALNLAGVLTTLALLLLAEGYGRSPYFDVSLTLAIVSFAGSLAFVRFMERWL